MLGRTNISEEESEQVNHETAHNLLGCTDPTFSPLILILQLRVSADIEYQFNTSALFLPHLKSVYVAVLLIILM